MLFTLLSQSIIYLLILSFHPLLNPLTHTPPLSIPSLHSPHCFSTMESPWYIFRAAELVHRHRALSLSFHGAAGQSQPSDHMLSAASAAEERSYLLGAHMLRLEMNDWHSGDLPGWQWPGGVEDCFRMGCHGLLQRHSSVAGVLSPGQKAAKYFHILKGHLGLKA